MDINISSSLGNKIEQTAQTFTSRAQFMVENLSDIFPHIPSPRAHFLIVMLLALFAFFYSSQAAPGCRFSRGSAWSTPTLSVLCNMSSSSPKRFTAGSLLHPVVMRGSEMDTETSFMCFLDPLWKVVSLTSRHCYLVFIECDLLWDVSKDEEQCLPLVMTGNVALLLAGFTEYGSKHMFTCSVIKERHFKWS